MAFSPKTRLLTRLRCSPIFIKLGLLIISLGLLYLEIANSSNYNRINAFKKNFEIVKVDVAKKIKHQDQLDFKISDVKLDRSLFEYLVDNLVRTSYPGVNYYTTYFMNHFKVKSLSGVKPLRPDFGPVLNDVTSYRYPIQIQPCIRIGSIDSKPNQHTVFVAIVSVPNSFNKREIVRETWLSHLKSEIISEIVPVGIGFVLGLTKNQTIQRQVEEESRKYGDIIQMDVIDNCYNLTLKTVGIANWVKSYCPSVDFVIKTDDNLFVNVRNLESAISSLNSSEIAIYGGPSDSTPIRKKDSKFSIGFDEWPWSNYPIYVTGNLLLITGKAFESLLAAAQTTPFLHLEDVYFNGLCTEKSGVKIRLYKMMVLRENYVNPCYIYTAISWLANTEESMMESNLLTELFYNNITECFINGSDENPKKSKSSKRNHFTFVTVNQFDF